MKRLVFKAGDRPHEMILTGDLREFDEGRLVQDLSVLCGQHIDFFGAAPFKRYLFS